MCLSFVHCIPFFELYFTPHWHCGGSICSRFVVFGLCCYQLIAPSHDDVIKWKHFPLYRPFMWGIHRSPVTDVSFDLRMNKRFTKQSRRWWFDTPLPLLWRHCNGECYSNFKYLISKHIIQIGILGTLCNIALRWMPQNLTNEKCFREWLDPVRQQVITWVNVNPELCRQMVPLGHSELIQQLPITSTSVRVISLAQRQSDDCPNSMKWTNPDIS